MARYQPDVAADDERFAAAFAQRVSSATELWRSFRADGYDERYPIVLRQPGPKTELPPGKPVDRPRYMGDGCHRLAMMVAAGADAVPPACYRLEPMALPRVLDNTSMLLPFLRLSEAAYAEFLALGYGATAAPTVAVTLAAIATVNPARWPEAVAVAAADGYVHTEERASGSDPGS